MLKYYSSLLILLAIACSEKNTPPEKKIDFNDTKTNTYQEVIAFYKQLSEIHPTIKILEAGPTDAGLPLHMVVYNKESYFDFKKISKEKAVLFINNGIHPGEPDGIDASMKLFSELASGVVNAPENTVIVCIPVYNIGGALNRNSSSRANQNGPEEYGFRGNARNYDLNRDFIKSDSKNARAFAEVFHKINPDVFIDTHVSNGADYQYTLTHLFTQHNKLGGELGTYLQQTFIPEFEQNLLNKEWEITPYVNVFNRPPDAGFSQFFDSPRYSTGYTTLFNTLGMMIETHMLKPYKNRVEGTYEILKTMLELTDKNYIKIKELRAKANKNYLPGSSYPIGWQIDSTQVSSLNFKGFEATYKTSDVTGQNRLFYDREKPFSKQVEYYNYFKPTNEVKIPVAYVIPKGWWNVIDLLKINQIKLTELKKDTTITAEVYRIEDYKTRTTPYEGHYLHYETKVSKKMEQITVSKGDFLVFSNQPGIRYLLETLEPEATDSFFNWNFFDTILQQKEGFSPYVFEEVALELLNNNIELKQEFEIKKESDESFKNNWYAQLNWLYKKSEYYEEAHLRYPILRVLD